MYKKEVTKCLVCNNLHMGVIDILTKFNCKKKLEYIYFKSTCTNGQSCIPPYEYSSRFYDFIEKNWYEKEF